MTNVYLPEGYRLNTPENLESLATVAGMERAIANETILEGIVTLCDENLRLHIDLGCAEGLMEADEVLYRREGEARKDIAIITRVGKPIAFRVLSLESRGKKTVARLSRRLAQEACLQHCMNALRPGDIIPARVTHLEPFGAFLDIGCGLPSLLSVDCISVSRISHPHDRMRIGMSLFAVVKSIDRESCRIYTSLRELLGTWEENAARFEPGQTVTGIIRSVESYGVFVELAPNLAGLAELREGDGEELRRHVGKSVAVYIKSIVPSRMKIKLILIDTCCEPTPPRELTYFVDPEKVSHISRWRYSPPLSSRCMEAVFDSE